MKILKPGIDPEEYLDWWFDAINKCKWCGAEYVLEEDDSFKLVRFRRPDLTWSDEAGTVHSSCPTCSRNVETSCASVASVGAIR